MINFDQIEADIFVGSAPQSSIDVARLKKLNVTAVISLQSDEDFKTHDINWKRVSSAYQFNQILIQRYPIMDFSETDLGRKLSEPVKGLNDLLSQGNRVYVHCNAGICRAPATVLAYLCHYRGMTIPEGLEYIRRQRPQVSPYRSAITRALAILKAEESTQDSDPA